MIREHYEELAIVRTRDRRGPAAIAASSGLWDARASSSYIITSSVLIRRNVLSTTSADLISQIAGALPPERSILFDRAIYSVRAPDRVQRGHNPSRAGWNFHMSCELRRSGAEGPRFRGGGHGGGFEKERDRAAINHCLVPDSSWLAAS